MSRVPGIVKGVLSLGCVSREILGGVMVPGLVWVYRQVPVLFISFGATSREAKTEGS